MAMESVYIATIAQSLAFLALLIIMWIVLIPRKVDEYTAELGTSFGTEIERIFVNPTVKKGFSLAQGLSVESRVDKNAEREVAGSILDNMAPEIPIILEKLGLEDVMEKYGPEQMIRIYMKYKPFIDSFMGQKQGPRQGVYMT